MSWAEKIVHSCEPLQINLGILFTPFNFAMLRNVSTLLTTVCLLGKKFFKMFLAGSTYVENWSARSNQPMNFLLILAMQNEMRTTWGKDEYTL